MTGLFDTHFHLEEADDATAVVAAARAAGVADLMLVSVHGRNAERNLQLAEALELRTTTGVHPLYIEHYDGEMAPYELQSRHARVRAIGEIGLDYFYHKDAGHQARQRDVFRGFLRLSRQCGKPAVIHCRDAFADCLRLVDAELAGAPFILHCYTGDAAVAEQVLALGGYLSYSGIVTFRNAASLRESLRAVPDDRLLLETDSPWLAPVPHRGERNQPAYLPAICAEVAALRGSTPAAIAALTTANARRLLGD